LKVSPLQGTTQGTAGNPFSGKTGPEAAARATLPVGGRSSQPEVWGHHHPSSYHFPATSGSPLV